MCGKLTLRIGEGITEDLMVLRWQNYDNSLFDFCSFINFFTTEKPFVYATILHGGTLGMVGKVGILQQVALWQLHRNIVLTPTSDVKRKYSSVSEGG